MPSVDEILFELVALDPADRASGLDHLCGSDRELRGEVESLLVAYGEARGGKFLLESPLTLAAMTDGGEDEDKKEAADPWVGRRLGPYRVAARIGDGGMGSVYEAERDDAEFQKRVAIKVIRRGMDGVEILRRFRRERQILAGLEHPNIARLLDGGSTEDGEPFLAMEYVEGLPVDQWCADHGVGLESRLRLFLQVCDAVQYAHQRLVVHRDLKPGNILVAGSEDDPSVKLLDFGIAKLLRDGEGSAGDAVKPAVPLGPGAELALEAKTTLARHRVLTPAYASPEQHGGADVTTASDVYSLGVVLFRLLTGDLPGQDAEAASLSRSAATSQLPGVPEDLRSSWPRRLRGDLEAIAGKALRSEPEERYASAEGLAEDVRRHLDHLPVTARKPTWIYRARKLVRRRTIAVVSGVLLALALATSTVVSSALFLRAEEALGMAETERASAQEVSEFLASLLTAGNPAEGASGTDTTVRQVLDEAAPRIAGELAEQPVVAARLLTIVAEAYQTLGLFDEAEERAVEGLDLLDRATSAVSERFQLLRRLAYIHHDQGRFDDGLARADQAEQVAAVDGLDHREEKALALVRASLYNESGRWQESAEAFRRVLEHQDLEADERRQAVQGLGIILSRLGRYGEAVAYLRQNLELVRRLEGPTHPAVAQAYNDLAWTLLRDDKAEEAVELLRRSLATYRENYSDDHPKVSIALMNMGNALVVLDRPEEALPFHEQGVKAMTQGWGPEHSYTASAINNLGNSLHAAGRFEEASQRFAAAAEIYGRVLSPMHPYVAIALRLRSQSEAALGNADAAYDLARKALEIRRQALPSDHRDLTTSLVEVAEMELERGAVEVAVEKLEQALVISPPDCEWDICRLAESLLAKAKDEREVANRQ